LGHVTVRRARFGATLFLSPEIRRSVIQMRETLNGRRFALQALMALGGGFLSRSLLAEPNISARAPGTPEDLSGALADPEPLFAAPTRLDRIGRVMTQVMVNGKGPFRFVIDTGASRSTLSPHLAKALGLKHSVGRNVMLNGVTGFAEVPTVAVQSIEIGGLKFENQDLPVIFTSIMGNADGILGVAGFADQRIDVDFKRDRVTVLESNGRRPHYSMVTARAQRDANGLMILDVRVGRRIKAKAVVDTGAERTLGNLTLQNAMNKGKRSRQQVSAVVHGATPDIADGDVQEIKEARIGDLTLTNLEVIFADFHVFKLWGLDQAARDAHRHGHARRARPAGHRLPPQRSEHVRPARLVARGRARRLLTKHGVWPQGPRLH
jgi:predicted aspartyl protease